jgi:biopolymer transport protein ExbD
MQCRGWTGLIAVLALAQSAHADAKGYCSWVADLKDRPTVELLLDHQGHLYWNNSRIEQKTFSAYLSSASTSVPTPAFVVISDSQHQHAERQLLATIRQKGLLAETNCIPQVPIPSAAHTEPTAR